ncbi:MAG: twin-arginine translocase TatA/TatE family subunit [Silvanigrellaceae bacterium]
MFGIGGGEIVVVALVALILFGNEDLPKNMKKLVEGWNKFRGVSNDLQRSWLNVRDQVTRDLLSDEHPRPPENDPNAISEQKDSSDTSAVVSGVGEIPPPEGLHDGALGASAVVIQPAEGAVAQGEPVEVSGSTEKVESVETVAVQSEEAQTTSLPDSDKST